MNDVNSGSFLARVRKMLSGCPRSPSSSRAWSSVSGSIRGCAHMTGIVGVGAAVVNGGAGRNDRCVASYPQQWEADVVATDGGTVHLRPITPDDADALVALHGRLSDQTRYFR